MLKLKKFFYQNQSIKRYLLIIFTITIIFGSIVFCGFFENMKTIKTKNGNVLSYNKAKIENVIYLSDIPYQKAQVGWGTLGLDKTSSNASLILNIEGASVIVKKGIFAHATSTIEYDISSYKDYDYFTTYYGLNTTAGNNGNGVKFYIYTSEDGKNWTLRTEENPVPLKGVNSAVHVKIDIRDANYIKLYANDNGSNGNDHAVWGDAKLIKEDYDDNVMQPVEEFDKLIKESYKEGAIEDDLKLTLLQRTFIKRVGQYQLRSFLDSDPKNKETLDWFLNNEEALRLWTIGGRPNGTYERSLQVLSNLYHTYKDDLSNENETSLGTKYKDLYLKMMLSLSLTHSTNVGLWIGGNQLSDAVTRYQIYKDMHLNGQLDTAMFESYTIDEMRGVMITNIDDEEILWLHDYSMKYSANERFNPYKYINYTLSYGYYRPQYYSQANYAKWDQKYNLSKYNITYQSGKPKLWIVFEEGAVCGGLSKTAANLYGVWGYPGRVVGQPGHAAYVYLYNAGGGKYAWQLANNVVTTGWANTSGNGINGWGTKYATNSGGIQSGSYLLLSQDAQNEYDKYEKAELILLLEDVYKNDSKKLEQIYRDALKEEIINLDAWIGLINLYLSDDSKTESDLIDLAFEISEVYKYHPLPMYDMTRRIGTKVTSPAFRSRLMMLQDETLREATKATSKDTIYTKEVPVIANAILGVVDSRIATFSFDGANAGKIVLSKQLQSAQVAWTYSIDGGNTWIPSYEHTVQLTKEQLDSLTGDNDIKIHITGIPLTPENIYTIDIQKGIFPSNVVSIDDLENRIMGATDKMEWTLDPDGEWNSFTDTNPIFKGDVRVYVRMLATGIYTMSDPVYFTFTTNTTSESHRYITRDSLKVIDVSGTSGGNKDNIIDGNINTAWHSYYNKNSLGQKYIPAYATIELDKPKYVSEIDYVPDAKATSSLGKYPAGKANRLDIYVSMDGTNWELAATKSNIGNNNNLKKITFDSPILAKYVRINCPSVYEVGLQYFFSIALINLYEDPSASEIPTADINYNIVKPTNKDVIAELVDENRPITITNNDGKKTYTFKENGEFTFEFVDRNGNRGTETAKVDWIDKEAPNANVEFSTTEITNENVVATISFDKENITILSNDIELATNPVDGSKTITFLENKSVELKFQDGLGNIGTKTITVDWIDTEAPTAEFEFNTIHLTDGEVIATLKPSEEVIITNNGGNDTYIFKDNGEFTFEFVDIAGNAGTATVFVNWIAKMPRYEIKYSTTSLTNQDVKVILELEEGYRIFNNNASNEYTFTNNETFNFQYKDKNGYDGIIPVTVDWIDKEAPTAEFEFSTKEWTNQNVVVTLKPNEEVTITNNGGNDTYTFIDNGEFTFEFVDLVGNKGSSTVKVDWIDKEAPTATIEYSTQDITEGPVIATLKPNENVTILGNGASTYTFTENAEFTFEFMDRAGNKGYATAVVTWIKKKTSKPEDNENNTKPDIKPEEKPGTSTKPNIPSTGNNTTPSEPNNDNQTTENSYKEISNGNVSIKIPESILSNYNDVLLDYKKQNLTDAQINRYGKESEIFEISLETKDNQKINLSNEKIEHTIKLNPNKTFEALYVVRDDGSVVKLNIQKVDNKIVFTNTGLGKYIVSYKSLTNDINDNNVEDNQISEETSEKKTKNILLPIGVGLTLTIGGTLYFVRKKNKKRVF